MNDEQLAESLANEVGNIAGAQAVPRDDAGRFVSNNDDVSYGLSSMEAGLGYQPLETAHEDAVIEQEALEAAIELARQDDANSIPMHHEDELATIPAVYLKTDGSGEPMAENVTLTPEKAGEDLLNYEGNLQSYVEGADLANLVQTVDAARADLVKNNPEQAQEYGLNREEVLAQANAQKEAEQPIETQQPELAAKAEENWPGLDPEAARALENPQIREMLQSQVAQSEQARQQYVAALQTANKIAYSRLESLIPDIAAMPVAHREGAFMHLAQTDPARFNAACAELNAVAQVVASQQQQSQYSEARSQHEFNSWAKAEDAALGKMPGGQVSAADQKALLDYLPEVGLDRDSYAQLLMTDRTARSALGQRLMLDAARGHAIRNAPKAVTQRTPPTVQRPGNSDGRSARDVDMSQLDARLSATGNVEDAWALYQARNGRR